MRSEAEPGVMWMEMTMGTRMMRRSHKTTTTTARTVRDDEPEGLALLHDVRSEKQDGEMLKSEIPETGSGRGRTTLAPWLRLRMRMKRVERDG